MKCFIDLTSLTLSALSINPNDSFIEETTPFQRKKIQKYIMSLNKIVFFLVTYQAAFVVEIQPSADSMFNNYVAMERLGA